MKVYFKAPSLIAMISKMKFAKGSNSTTKSCLKKRPK